ncbi:MAG: hypothetical protein ACOYY2_04820 [Actinomycetota bacterium]
MPGVVALPHQGAHPLPQQGCHPGAVYVDARGSERRLRVSWHSEQGLVVLSLWRGEICAGTFRLPVEDVPALVDLLESGLADASAEARTPRPLGRHRPHPPS